MKRIIAKVGPCSLRRNTSAYVSLVKSILSQQVSVKAATAMYEKLRKSVPGKRIAPARVATFLQSAPEQSLRDCGLSRQKRRYVQELSVRFVDGRMPTRKFARMTDDEVSAVLTECVGIGKWTAEMFLMFTLNRPDVWPVGDLGLRQSVVNEFDLPDREDWDAIEQLGEQFRPWRTIACWYFWRAKGD